MNQRSCMPPEQRMHLAPGACTICSHPPSVLLCGQQQKNPKTPVSRALSSSRCDAPGCCMILRQASPSMSLVWLGPVTGFGIAANPSLSSFTDRECLSACMVVLAATKRGAVMGACNDGGARAMAANSVKNLFQSVQGIVCGSHDQGLCP